MALSRAIGDFEFKKGADLSPEQQIVTAFPDVITHEVSSDDEFLVIACDGEVVHFTCPAHVIDLVQESGIVNRPKQSSNSSEEESLPNRTYIPFVKT